MSTENESEHLSERLSENEQSTKMMDDDSTQMPNLIHEVILEILSRLPVKSLLRFRCVCKYWRSLISDTHFIKKHLLVSITDESYRHHRLLCSSWDLEQNFKSCSIYSILNEESVDALEVQHPFDRDRNSDRMIGSCNGLVCMTRRDNFHVWNPSTNKCRKLELFGSIERFRNVLGDNTFYGFGYDHFSDDYKLLAIICYTNEGSFETEVDVYSLKTNSWKTIPGSPYGAPHGKFATYVNGALHWWVFCVGDMNLNSPLKMVAFDLANETYREVLEPTYQDNKCHRELGVLGGNLCVTCHYHDSRADIWVMKEYGVRESWIKLLTIPSHVAGTSPSQYSLILCYWKNGIVLLKYRMRICLYNSKDDAGGSPKILGFYQFKQVAVYVESLVSPHPSNELTGTP